jgi:hypothetical protein
VVLASVGLAVGVSLALATLGLVLLVAVTTRLVLVVMSHFILRQEIIFYTPEGGMSGLISILVFHPPMRPGLQNQFLGTGVNDADDSDVTHCAQMSHTFHWAALYDYYPQTNALSVSESI